MANYNHIYENAIAQIEATRQREVEAAKQKVMQEEVVPFNRDIDISLRDAIAELQARHNAKIAQLQQSFDAEKVVLAESANKRKESFAESAIFSAVSEINASADAAIAHIKKMIDEEA